MNKYETYLDKTVGWVERVRDLLMSRDYWMGIDELIERPDILPYQERGMNREGRIEWANSMKRCGYRFVLIYPEFDGFSIRATSKVPHMRYKHISKAWRDAK